MSTGAIVTSNSNSDLAPKSVLADLPASDFQVSPETVGDSVAKVLQQNPDIPGVLICEHPKLVGMISREQFLERLSRPFGVQLFMNRPIQLMLDVERTDPLVLDSGTHVDRAAQIALGRPRDLVYQPIIIAYPGGNFRLLGVYTLLLAQSHLLVEANVIIQRQKDAADAANKAKSSFLANMSHEIRTPMNGVLGLTEILLDTPLSDAQYKYLKLIRESANSLLNVINDILDFSKVEASRLELETVQFALRECLGDALTALALRAQRKGIELVCRIRPDVPDLVVGDPLRLRQVVTNLVNNAIKFTECGEVVLEVEMHGCISDTVDLHIHVRDTGVGIPADKLSDIFNAFTQVGASTARTHGGTGLGLAISRKLIELMNGRVWVESEVDHGSTFHFTARLGLPTRAADPPRQISPIADGTHVLVVDDNATTLAVLKEMLESWRITPLTASTIAAADELLVTAERSISLVVIDNALGREDGFDLARQLLTRRGASPRVIMLLAASEHGFDLARCEELGVDACVTKPVKQSELFDAIAAALGGIHAGGHPLEQSDLPLRRRTVLLVEDGAVNQTVARGLLEPRGHLVIVANNGHEALAKFSQRPFDLILMDVQMPGMDGFGATERIRQLESITGAHTPIAAMTANAMTGDRERCLAAGMDGYLAKPIRKCELLAVVESKWIESVTSHGSGDLIIHVSPIPPQAMPGHDEFDAAKTLSLSESHSVSDSIHIDWNRALAELSGDAALLALLVNTLLEEAPNLLSKLHRALAGRNAGQLRLAAHTLKGSVSHLGVERLTSVLELLEAAAKAGEMDDVQGLFLQVEEDFTKMVPVLNDFAKSRRDCGMPAESPAP
jgi:signal transduction histidine kinase/DNA-binding response OmpR family regulator/HPt (histidine-containing phosphotransfer) domain-containing protein